MPKHYAILLAAGVLTATAAVAFTIQPSVQAPQVAAATNSPARGGPARAVAAGHADRPVLVELFTSQGCSSCPPADAVLGRLARDPGIVAITRPVTYWDRLGWRDTLGREANTDLQRAYAARGLGDGSVFTPEAVVHGATGMIGSREAAVRSAAATVSRAVTLSVVGDRVSAGTAVQNGAQIKFIAVANRRQVRIGGGENGGRLIDYHNVVLDEASVNCPASGACAASVPARLHSVGDRIAVVLQRGSAGEVLAARWM
jgi:hypothetical protein